MRSNVKLVLLAPLFAIRPFAAAADDGETAKLIAECSAADLPKASVDSCLERARVLEETEPSAQLQSLEGSLEQQESGNQRTARSMPAPAASMSPAQEIESRSTVVEDGAIPESPSIPEPSDAAISRVRPGSEAEDEPPIADPPDAPAAGDRPSDEDNDPGQSS